MDHLPSLQLNPSPTISSKGVTFPDGLNRQPTSIPRFNPDEDKEGVATHVPHMDHFYENSLQTGLMRDLAVDLELLGEHLVLLGNQVAQIPVFPKCLAQP